MATTPQNRNLLQLDELDQAYESAQLYVVHSGQDYRISLETLLSLITKARLGIENVDNTKDVDKSVSNPTQQAITEAISNLVGRAEFDALVQSIQTSVDQETLDAAIANINLTLNSLSIALENKADRTHLHLVTHIEDFELEVRRIAAEYVGDTTGLNIGPNEW